jgi:hypothetical protein
MLCTGAAAPAMIANAHEVRVKKGDVEPLV